MSVISHDDRLSWVVFTIATSPYPLTSEDESDDSSGNDDADEDENASSPSDDEMST